MQNPSTFAGNNVSPARGTVAGSEVDSPTVVTCYGWGGNEVKPEDPTAIAKTSFDPATKTTRYWLKRATSGRDRGNLFNPMSSTGAPDALKRVATQLGKGTYEFRTASKESFELYMKFATPPHNPAYFRNAERN